MRCTHSTLHRSRFRPRALFAPLWNRLCDQSPPLGTACSTAAAEFRKFIDHYGIVGNFPWGARARLSLARAYALDAQNNPAALDQARAAYQNFLTLWKDADSDIPIYQQAKAEYAKLQ